MATAKHNGSSRKKNSGQATLTNARNRPLRSVTEDSLKKYFKDLNGHAPGDLYELVLSEIEKPLFKTVMDHTQGNQSRAAEILGMNRATLRKKLKTHCLLD